MAAWFLAGVALAADPPDARGSMLSFRKLSAHSDAALGSSPTPVLGELHDRLALPPNATCEVLLAVAASSVNPSDFDPAVAADDFPRVLGSDVAALVLRAGRSCRRLAAGDRVWGDIGANARTYRTRAPTKELGAYAPYAVALEAQLGRLPRLLSLREGGAVPKVGLTSLKALRWYAGAPAAWRWRRADSTVLVLGGSGGTGSMGLQLAKAYGAARLITDHLRRQLRLLPLARGGGADRLPPLRLVGRVGAGGAVGRCRVRHGGSAGDGRARDQEAACWGCVRDDHGSPRPASPASQHLASLLHQLGHQPWQRGPAGGAGAALRRRQARGSTPRLCLPAAQHIGWLRTCRHTPHGGQSCHRNVRASCSHNHISSWVKLSALGLVPQHVWVVYLESYFGCTRVVGSCSKCITLVKLTAGSGHE